MPKIARELTPAAVRRLPPGTHAVGGVPGLLAQIHDSGCRSWVLRVVIGARRRDIGLGGHEVSLAEARERARQARELIRQGVDPVAQRRQQRLALEVRHLTFGEAAIAVVNGKRHEFRSKKHAEQWRSTLETHCAPIWRLPVAEVTLPRIVSILEPLWTEKTETASRLRGRIEAVLAWATVSGYRSGDNPARWSGNLDAVLPKPGKVRTVKHHPALPWQELPLFMARLRACNGTAARALEFLILTAARSGEVRLATWSEFDLEGKVWTIPGARMKAGREHRVPLTADAVRLVKLQPRGSDFVFAAPRGGAFSDAAFGAVLRRIGRNDIVPHGFRSTFRDWCAESTAYPRDVAEMALAHTIGDKVEAAYRRGDLWTKRQKLMRDWEAHANKPPKAGKVVNIRG